MILGAGKNHRENEVMDNLTIETVKKREIQDTRERIGRIVTGMTVRWRWPCADKSDQGNEQRFTEMALEPNLLSTSRLDRGA